jgi:hypothetical protein
VRILFRNTTVIIFFICTVLHLSAQAPDTAWTKTFGGSDDERAYSVWQTHDGGYILAGYACSYGAGGYDVYLVKTNSLGDTLWTRTFGEDGDDFGYSVQQTSDKGYIITGIYGSDDLYADDIYLIKTDSMGDSVWIKTYGKDMTEEGKSVQQTTDGGYIISGTTYRYGVGGSEIYIMKTNSSGDSLWMKTFGAEPGISIKGTWVQQTDDGGYIITGYRDEYRTPRNQIYLIKTDSVGDTTWIKIFGGIYDDEAKEVRQTNDGGYVIVGYTASYGAGDGDVYLLKTNSMGDSLWAKTFGGGCKDAGGSVQQTDDGGYILSGIRGYCAAGRDIYIIKTDSLGDTLWTKTAGGSGFWETAPSVLQSNDGGYVIAGCTDSYGAGGTDMYLIKLEPDVSGIENNTPPEEIFVSAASPNPFTNETTLTYTLPEETSVNISVNNILGQEMEEFNLGKKSAGVHTFTWRGTSISGEILPSGIYFLKVKAGKKEASSKIMYIK